MGGLQHQFLILWGAAGSYLVVRSGDVLFVHDWETGVVVRRIDVMSSLVVINEAGTRMLIVSDSMSYVLQIDAKAAQVGAPPSPAPPLLPLTSRPHWHHISGVC